METSTFPVFQLVGLGLWPALLYLGFAPRARRWQRTLGLCGVIIGLVLWVWTGASFSSNNGHIRSSVRPMLPLCLIPFFVVGTILAVTLRGRRRQAALLLGVALPFLAGLLTFGSIIDRESAAWQSSLDQHRAIWQTHQPAHYRFTIHTLMFCEPGHCSSPKTVTVAPGYTPEWTVETLFDRIQTGIDRKYDHVEATYDPELGYPTEIYTYPDILITDQGVRLIISDFQILP